MMLPVNPYIAGNPLRGEKGFFGRQDVLQWVIRELRNPTTNALVLAGQRRIGKTSLLLQLERIMPREFFLPVYFDLQDKAVRPLGQVLAELAYKITKCIKCELPDADSFDDEGRFFLNSFLPSLYQILDSNCRLVLLFDEFDVMDQAAKEDMPESAAARVLFQFLRSVMAADLRPAFVFVVGRHSEDLSLDLDAILKVSLRRDIWVLDRNSAELLVRFAETNETLHFADSAVAYILNLTSGHPYLIQLLCQRIWERVYQHDSTAPMEVDVLDVKAAIPDALEAGHQALIWLWNGLNPAEKIYASALAEAADKEDEIISEDQVIKVLTTHAPRLRTREVELAPHNLVRHWVLERSGKQEYHFSVELLRLWVRDHRPLQDVKNELDRIEPLAEKFYEIGQEVLRRGKLDDAISNFQHALEANPEHLHALLDLGEVFLRLGQIDEAINFLETAYKLDESETRLPLARALVEQAKIQNEKGDNDSALITSTRALGLSPGEHTAQEIINKIWIRRGNTAMERGALEVALSSYQQVGVHQWEEAITLVEQTLLDSPALFRTRFHLCEVLLLLGKAETALVHLNTALTVCQQQDDHYIKEVENFLRETLKKRPKFTFARFQLGQLLLSQRQIHEALDQFDEAYEEGTSQSDPIMPHLLLVQAEVAQIHREWYMAFTACVRALKIDPSLSHALDILDHIIIEWKRRKITNLLESQTMGAGFQTYYGQRTTPGLTKRQLLDLMSDAEGSVCLLGVVALNADTADWQMLAKKWSAKAQENPEFTVQILCESDNILFSKSFTCDNDSATNRLSFQALQFIRKRATFDFPNFLQIEGITKANAQINVQIMHLPIPVSVVQIDNKIFANLWLHEVEDHFEEITELHPWQTYLEKYISTYFGSKIGLKFACDPRDEVLELFDNDKIPRGIYPRSSFYDTDFSQLVVWALIFDRKGRLLIHRRAENAKDNQGMWDKSVGGHTSLSDINTSEAITREVIEELFSEEIKQSKADLTVLKDTAQDMIFLGEWRPGQRQSHPFQEIKSFNREWTFFQLGTALRQHLSSPRTMPKDDIKDLRVIADVFIFVAGPQLTEEYLKKLKNSTFKLVELSILRDAMGKTQRGEMNATFHEDEQFPKFSPDLTNIMKGELRGVLEQFSQYIIDTFKHGE